MLTRPSTFSFRLRLTGALGAAALAGALTGCGGSDSSTTADAGTSLSSPSTDSSSSAPADGGTSATTDPSQAASTFDSGGSVAVDDFVKMLQGAVSKTQYAHMEFTMSGTGGDITGTGDSDYTADPPDSSLTMSVGGQQMSMLTIGHVMYLQTSQSGKKYLKYDLDDPNNPLGSQLSDQLDPASSMTSFAKAVTAVSSYGRENVGGRKLDHYEMTVDTSKLATGASSGLPADLKADVWFDSEGRLAQLRMDLGAVTYDATLTDFDKAVHLSAPPASQVTEAQPPTGQG